MAQILWDGVYQPTRPISECIIDGKTLRFDGCSGYSLESAQSYYNEQRGWHHIGEGYVYFIGGARQESSTPVQFFISK